MAAQILQISESSLPTQFENVFCKNHSNKHTVCIRSNLKTMEDINSWVAMFGQQTNTQWNSRSSLPKGIKIVCS